MRLGKWQFAPSLLMTVLFLAIGSGMLALGFWQLNRANEKIVMQQAADDAAQSEAIDITQIDSQPTALQYRQVKLQGRFEAGRQFLWDNRVIKGRVGFEVITPFRSSPGNQLILVNRGWVPLGNSRNSLPDIGIGTVTEVEFTGLFTRPSIGFSSGDAVNLEEQSWPRILQHFDYDQIALSLEEPVLPGLIQVIRDNAVVENAMASLGGARLYPDNWQPVAFGPERHYGYAFQWFAMFVALSGLYLFLNINLNSKKSRIVT